MNNDNKVAETVASYLLEIQAIKLNAKDPFTWASGLRSPIYCDNRIALSYPKKRTYIKNQLANVIKDNFSD
ncbi:MAG: orotate phosphoribosyltransferase, partial [Bacteroidota bacterium]